MDSFNSTEHFELHRALSKLVKLEKISTDEMEILLSKSGLTIFKFLKTWPDQPYVFPFYCQFMPSEHV